MTFCGKKQYELMGIVNLTDNSFFSPSRLASARVDDVLLKVAGMLEDGADIIDIGACSTAPGNGPVDEDCEWGRLENVLPVLFSSFPKTVFSLDTFRPSILARTIDLGRKVIANDIMAARIDNEMLSIVKSNGLEYIAVDSSSDPEEFFTRFSARTEKTGLDNWILDPGFGFGKTMERNWEILENLQALQKFGRKILVALSHKRMIYMREDGLTAENCTLQSVEAEKLAARLGASIIRTHDLKAHAL